jgi:hypothetical protein
MAAYSLYKHEINILKLNNSHKYCALFQNGTLSSKPLRLIKGFRFLKEEKNMVSQYLHFLENPRSFLENCVFLLKSLALLWKNMQKETAPLKKFSGFPENYGAYQKTITKIIIFRRTF